MVSPLPRREQEELYADFQKSVEALKKENDALIKKEKIIDKALRDTEGDIQTFQTEKQRKLNQLHVVVMISMRQILHLVPPEGAAEGAMGVLPDDTSDSLVFAHAELIKLRRRYAHTPHAAHAPSTRLGS